MKQINGEVLVRIVAGILLGLVCLAVSAQQAVVELRSTVKGNQEQPKVLYIVPWQPPTPGEVTYQPLQTLVSDVFEPVDREEFVRQIEYQEQLHHVNTTADSVNSSQ